MSQGSLPWLSGESKLKNFHVSEMCCIYHLMDISKKASIMEVSELYLYLTGS